MKHEALKYFMLLHYKTHCVSVNSYYETNISRKLIIFNVYEYKVGPVAHKIF